MVTGHLYSPCMYVGKKKKKEGGGGAWWQGLKLTHITKNPRSLATEMAWMTDGTIAWPPATLISLPGKIKSFWK